MIARTCSSYSLFVARRVVSGPSGRTISKEKERTACKEKRGKKETKEKKDEEMKGNREKEGKGRQGKSRGKQSCQKWSYPCYEIATGTKLEPELYSRKSTKILECLF